MTAVLLLANFVALLIVSLAIRNEPLRFVLFFVLGCLVLALWKVFTELPWWGWLLFAVATAAALLAWRYLTRGSEHSDNSPWASARPAEPCPGDTPSTRNPNG